jgi:hypothetical protein
MFLWVFILLLADGRENQVLENIVEKQELGEDAVEMGE